MSGENLHCTILSSFNTKGNNGMISLSNTKYLLYTIGHSFMTQDTSIILESSKHASQDHIRLLSYFQMVQFSYLPLIPFISNYLLMGITSIFSINYLSMKSSYSNFSTMRISSFLQPLNLGLLPRLLLVLDSNQDIHNKHLFLKYLIQIHFTSTFISSILPFHSITLSILMIVSEYISCNSHQVPSA